MEDCAVTGLDARIMEDHGGSWRITERRDWPGGFPGLRSDVSGREDCVDSAAMWLVER